MNKVKSEAEEHYYRTTGSVAILVDGGFFLKRLRYLTKKNMKITPDYATKMVKILAIEHAKRLQQYLYRIFFYDCPPFENGLHNPLTKKFIKMKDSELYKFKMEFFSKLKAMRKVALRLGRLDINSDSTWELLPKIQKELLSNKKEIKDLDPEKDIHPNLTQKQVDMKIGIDIASMALKRQINTIVLVAGDGDFVPASKFARREGIDFILDPMRAKINPDLNEHIDGLMSVLFQKKKLCKASDN